MRSIKSLFVGIDIGGTDIKYGAFTADAESVYENQVSTPVDGIYNQFLDVLTSSIEELMYKTNCLWNQIDGIGIAVPGFIDYKKNIVLHMPNIGFKNVSLQQDLEARWHKPIFIDNDANLAALGESWIGAGKDSLHMVCITIGTGLGSGIIIDGKIYHGAMGLAGELGHLSIENSKLRECNCGNTGCLETEVSSRAISMHAMEIAKQQKQGILRTQYKREGTIQTRFIIEQAKLGDADCCYILAHAGEILGKALANVATVLNPEKILIGGGVAMAGRLILEPMKESFIKHCTPLIGKNTSIVLTKLGNRAGIIGAVKLAFDKRQDSNFISI